MDLLIPSAFGVEGIVKRQLSALGYKDCRAEDGKVALVGDINDIARLNLHLRSGERVLIKISSFTAQTFDEVYENVSRIRWNDYMDSHAKVLVDVKSVNSTLKAEKAVGGVLKKAIMNVLEKKYGKKLNEDGAKHVVGLNLKNDVATLTLDTSGDGLHKRGYRTLAYSAPLKETLASALIDLTIYDGNRPFADIFCGSGTIPIETALKARNIAPGINRSFDFENFCFVDKNVIKKAREEAKAGEKDSCGRIFAYDIDKNAISIARYHAKQAGVENDIHFQASDMRSYSSSHPYGVICSNPPYGERLSDYKQVANLYKDLGKLIESLPNWNAYFLTSFYDFEKHYGKIADKKRKLYNANIECCFYSYFSSKPTKKFL